ncbi:hypothetical protein PoB_002423500 [Plakobranchus ocellatus]|uniref:Uncharacterized protein n=1 Tax=Plakobranchus ocellatus TaxID=259542 RepID=A0AAV3ZPT2_9GAST|nr:hypothetical protein PoB_002423500 [Plakobranchus ocellatus]
MTVYRSKTIWETREIFQQITPCPPHQILAAGSCVHLIRFKINTVDCLTRDWVIIAWAHTRIIYSSGVIVRLVSQSTPWPVVDAD